MKIYYLANVRMPTEKAHGIQIVKMCEALIEAGIDVELIVPARGAEERPVKDFYALRIEIPVIRMWTPDWYHRGKTGFWISSLFFMAGYWRYLRKKKYARDTGAIWAIDTDQFSFFLAPFIGMPYIAEIHDAKSYSFFFRVLFERANLIVAVNQLIRRSLMEVFRIPGELIAVYPNGVDLDQFQIRSKADGRQKLRLAPQAKIALYTGRLYAWKGLEVFAEAGHFLGDIAFYIVGGSEEEFMRVTGVSDISPNLIFMGGREFQEIPVWVAAADVLVVGGTKKNKYSFLHTSPMKIFEYMSAGSEHAIVAADTPANRQILSDDEALFYEPDNGRDLAEKIAHAFNCWPEAAYLKGGNAREKVKRFTWKNRAESILNLFPNS